MAFAKKIPLLSADKAIFTTVPPHLLLGHTKFNIKKNQPNNITTLLAFIFYYYFYLTKYTHHHSANQRYKTKHYND